MFGHFTTLCIVFLNVRPLFLYLTKELVQISRTDESLFEEVNEYGKIIALIFYVHCIKLEECHLFPFIHSRFSFLLC